MKNTRLSRLLFCLALPAAAIPTQAGLINGGFEAPSLSPGSPSVDFPGTIPGWKTTDSAFEIWSDGVFGVPAYEGTQFAELNAFIAGTLYQDVSGIAAGARVGFEFAHRGRAGVDTMNFMLTDLGGNGLLGGGDDTVLFSKNYSDGTAAWGFYDAASEAPIYALGGIVRFAYTAVGFTSPSVGNFLDAADFGVGVGGVPTPDTGATLLLLGVAFCLQLPLRRRRN